MTPKESYLFQLGKKEGKEELLKAIRELLKLNDFVADQIANHESQYHDENMSKIKENI